MNDALNQKEAVFLRHKKTISIAIVAIILVVAGIICYETYVSGPKSRKQAQHWLKVRSISLISNTTRR